jgi:hypothetical protein
VADEQVNGFERGGIVEGQAFGQARQRKQGNGSASVTG